MITINNKIKILEKLRTPYQEYTKLAINPVTNQGLSKITHLLSSDLIIKKR